MNKHRYLAYAVVFVVLAALVYLQFRHWSAFDWPTFWREGRRLGHAPGMFHILHAVALIYLTYILRALRWKIFLRPVRPKVSFWRLVAPTMIGFTGLTLLGRPGELVRPYLIARRSSLGFASQLAVWVVERIFDVAAFTILIVAALFLPTKLRSFIAEHPKYVVLPFPSFLHLQPMVSLHKVVGYGLLATVLVFLFAAVATNYKGPAIADWVRRSSLLGNRIGERLAERIREFSSELNLIQGFSSFLQISAISLVMWFLIANAYKEVTHAYGQEALEIDQAQVLLLMGSSMVGSLVQLPGVGGGSQLATIAALEHIFGVPKELAASCGITLWLVTFVAVVPVGLILAHRERLSLRKLTEESQQEDASSVSPSAP